MIYDTFPCLSFFSSVNLYNYKTMLWVWIGWWVGLALAGIKIDQNWTQNTIPKSLVFIPHALIRSPFFCHHAEGNKKQGPSCASHP